MQALKTVILIEKGIVLVIYTAVASITLRQAHFGLHLAAMVTMAAFMLCLSGSFLVFLIDTYDIITNVNRLVYQIVDLVCNGVVLSILFYYTYEIRVVLLKV